MPPQSPEAVTRIAALNDLCRTALGVGGVYLQSEGVSALPAALQSRMREHIETYRAFTPDNDPWGERDFGAFDLDGHRFFWKIDYYTRDLNGGSDNPSDPRVTTRVLTAMLAEEY